MTGHVKVGGAWKDLAGASVKIGGVWKTVEKGFTKVGGAWKEWYSASNPAMDLIQTTVLSSPTSSVTFSGLGAYAADYKHLQIRMSTGNVYVTTLETQLRFNGDSNNNYSYHKMVSYGDGSVYSGAYNNQNKIVVNAMPNTTSQLAIAVVDILDFSNTSKNTTLRTFYGQQFNSNREVNLGSGAWYNTAAVTSVTLLNTGYSFVTGSRFSIYGIRG